MRIQGDFRLSRIFPWSPQKYSLCRWRRLFRCVEFLNNWVALTMNFQISLGRDFVTLFLISLMWRPFRLLKQILKLLVENLDQKFLEMRFTAPSFHNLLGLDCQTSGRGLSAHASAGCTRRFDTVLDPLRKFWIRTWVCFGTRVGRSVRFLVVYVNTECVHHGSVLSCWFGVETDAIAPSLRTFQNDRSW